MKIREECPQILSEAVIAKNLNLKKERILNPTPQTTRKRRNTNIKMEKGRKIEIKKGKRIKKRVNLMRIMMKRNTRSINTKTSTSIRINIGRKTRKGIERKKTRIVTKLGTLIRRETRLTLLLVKRVKSQISLKRVTKVSVII